MDQYEQELEERIDALKTVLEYDDLWTLLSEQEVTQMEGDQHTLEEKLYQYRLQKELDGLQVHTRKEQGV